MLGLCVMSCKVTVVTCLFTLTVHPIMPSAKPSANHRCHDNSDNEDEHDLGEEGAERETTTPDQSRVFRVDIDGISNRKQVQRRQGPDDIGNPSHTTPPIKPGDKRRSNAKPPVISVRRSSSLDWKKDRNRTEPNCKRPDHQLRLHKFWIFLVVSCDVCRKIEKPKNRKKPV